MPILKKLTSLFFWIISVACFAQVDVDEKKVHQEPKDTNAVNQVVDVMPVFPSNLGKYLSSKIIYPQTSIENEEEGKVIIGFIVEKDGSVSNAQVLKSSGYTILDKEAIRVVNNMPNWTPGMMDNKPVRVKFRLPVSFKLD